MAFLFLRSWFRASVGDEESENETESFISDTTTDREDIHEQTRPRRDSYEENHFLSVPTKFDTGSSHMTPNYSAVYSCLMFDSKNKHLMGCYLNSDGDDHASDDHDSCRQAIEPIRNNIFGDETPYLVYNPFTNKVEHPNHVQNPFDDVNYSNYITPEEVFGSPDSKPYVSIDSRLSEENDSLYLSCEDHDAKVATNIPLTLEAVEDHSNSKHIHQSSFRKLLSENFRRMFQRRAAYSSSVAVDESAISDSSNSTEGSAKKASNEIVVSSYSSKLGFKKTLSNQETDDTSAHGSLVEGNEVESFISNDNQIFNVMKAQKFKYLCFDKEVRSWEKTGQMPCV